MSLVDELARLEEMRARGTLSEEEFQRAKAKLIDTQPSAPSAAAETINKLRRSRSDKWLGGVCAGLGAVSGIETWIWRLMFVLLLMFGGVGVFAYLLLWIFVPLE
jgi:phage shock protein PspC (stress-responsive transcriptional regulator)